MNKISPIFKAFDISASGLTAQRRRLDAVSENLANVSTTRTSQGGPYKRKVAIFAEMQKAALIGNQEGGVQKDQLIMDLTRDGHMEGDPTGSRSSAVSGVKAEIMEDESDPRVVYDPGHPDADKEGYVKYPNINIVSEMVEMMSATRAYEANVSAIKAFKEMAKKALDI